MCPGRHDFVIPRWTISQISARPTDLFSLRSFLLSRDKSRIGLTWFVLATLYEVLQIEINENKLLSRDYFTSRSCVIWRSSFNSPIHISHRIFISFVFICQFTANNYITLLILHNSSVLYKYIEYRPEVRVASRREEVKDKRGRYEDTCMEKKNEN